MRTREVDIFFVLFREAVPHCAVGDACSEDVERREGEVERQLTAHRHGAATLRIQRRRQQQRQRPRASNSFRRGTCEEMKKSL